jgi:hypothetical protein
VPIGHDLLIAADLLTDPHGLGIVEVLSSSDQRRVGADLLALGRVVSEGVLDRLILSQPSSQSLGRTQNISHCTFYHRGTFAQALQAALDQFGVMAGLLQMLLKLCLQQGVVLCVFDVIFKRLADRLLHAVGILEPGQVGLFGIGAGCDPRSIRRGGQGWLVNAKLACSGVAISPPTGVWLTSPPWRVIEASAFAPEIGISVGWSLSADSQLFMSRLRSGWTSLWCKYQRELAYDNAMTIPCLEFDYYLLLAAQDSGGNLPG